MPCLEYAGRGPACSFASTGQRFATWTYAYKKAPHEKVKRQKRQKARDYREPDYPYKFVAEKY